MRGTIAILFGSALLLGGCTSFPELDETVGPGAKGAAFPNLVPIGTLTRDVGLSQSAQSDLESNMEQRVNALRARAARLSGNVIDRRTKSRMARGVQGI